MLLSSLSPSESLSICENEAKEQEVCVLWQSSIVFQAKDFSSQPILQKLNDNEWNFLNRFETSSVHDMSRKTDVSQETIDDLTSKVIQYGKDSKEKDHF